MEAPPGRAWTVTEQDRSIAETVDRERARLRGFIRRRVPDPADAEDILQDVFHELIEAARLPAPVEQVGAWLFQVARNRVIDLFRRRRREAISIAEPSDDGEVGLGELLPSLDGGPEAAYARRVLLDELADALDELPEAQRSVFIAHELEGVSFKELAERTGDSVNTLLSRKRYAVLYLRRRLQAIHDEFVDQR
jgi:RNA polymerase sigma factor (sigma-70 family)